MTHEQKPESVEFRTRGRQIEIMTTNYMGAGLPIKAARKLATDEVTEAEARGAAEQRREHAEGAEPVAYRWAYDVPKGRDSLWHFGGDLPEPLPHRPEPRHVTPLYTRPANVAALEARVKELEGELTRVKSASFNHGYLIACCNISHLHDEPSIACDVLAECGLSVGDVSTIELSDYDAEALSQIRASRGDRDPIREGGEHV